MAPLRICLNAGFTREVGTYWTAYFLGNELVKRGHDVTLICISRHSRFLSHESTRDGLQIIECPNILNRPFVLHGMGPLDTFRRIRALSTRPFDIVHGFEYFPDVTLSAWITQRFRSYMFVSDWRDWYSKAVGYGRFRNIPGAARLFGWVEDRSRRTAAGVTVGSRELERHVLDLGFPSERVLLLHGGAPTDTVRPVPRLEARRAVGLDGEYLKIIGFVSSTHSPGLPSFEAPIAELFAEIPELRFMMIGNPDRQFLKSMTKRGWGERIITTGWVPDDQLSVYLGAPDVYILPLIADLAEASRWPLKFGDYMAAGRPVVGSAVGDTWRLLKEVGAGLVVNSDEQVIASALRRLLIDEVEALAMGELARKAAEEHLAWDHRARELEEFYERLLP